MNKKDILIDSAVELGFDAAGFAKIDIPEREKEIFDNWLAKGFQAGMNYMVDSRGKRFNSDVAFPAKSVLALLISHSHQKIDKQKDGFRLGRVARYAWSRDYHNILAPILAKLVEVAEKLSLNAKAYVDHGPILERSFAIRAGLGWHGKQSQVISTEFGALTTLAVLLTDLEIEAESPHPDRCGRCTSCIRACPTAAIVDGFVDARRCLSYYTIEHRGPIPREWRLKLGDHLFGCDDCLDVCPWTNKAGPIASLLTPEAELAYPDLSDFFSKSNRQFLRIYGDTAFARARRRGMARNAALVIGNSHMSEGIDLLKQGLNDPAFDVREASAWALGRLLLYKEAQEALENTKEEDFFVAQTINDALAGQFLYKLS